MQSHECLFCNQDSWKLGLLFLTIFLLFCNTQILILNLLLNLPHSINKSIHWCHAKHVNKNNKKLFDTFMVYKYRAAN